MSEGVVGVENWSSLKRYVIRSLGLILWGRSIGVLTVLTGERWYFAFRDTGDCPDKVAPETTYCPPIRLDHMSLQTTIKFKQSPCRISPKAMLQE